MRTVIQWKGKDYRSVEYCTIDSNADGYFIRSEFTGFFERQICQLVYEINATPQWDTQSVSVAALIGSHAWSCQLEKRTERWLLDGRLIRSFDPNAYPDISLSPFTNTLPIRGLNWTKPVQGIDVIYFDILARKVLPERQVYRCLEPGHFRLTANDSFTADIHVDTDGLVTDYPGLFERVAKQQFVRMG